MAGIFADIGPDLPIDGEQRFDDGSLIKLHAGLRQIVAGDVIQIQWMVDGTELVSLGNWIRGAVANVQLAEVTPKGGQSSGRVLWGNLQMRTGWRMGTVVPDVSATKNDEGFYVLGSRTTVQIGNVPWSWELRTDDLPGWDIYLVGHDCNQHPQTCDRPTHQALFDEARLAKTRSVS